MAFEASTRLGGVVGFFGGWCRCRSVVVVVVVVIPVLTTAGPGLLPGVETVDCGANVMLVGCRGSEFRVVQHRLVWVIRHFQSLPMMSTSVWGMGTGVPRYCALCVMAWMVSFDIEVTRNLASRADGIRGIGGSNK
ncbi:hypothetical protein P152DRAFT_295526 [Eremomyces bilateralis CBS 781.70]|uniref:Uncharacterized protein n=1 Tax=Eremomyces bilateralis CBS 781.70 TaxID=1392243 RepID=A0A6G1G748_9PEZI|nr:uncharacterized protein P152DRAFT_295526 [Eremomyces bilateralis CBS 781.70]KAF1813873.1 hypothetical protein P152DRAFT_295526 [Eremomyces bilateralis CBS 781.70]